MVVSHPSCTPLVVSLFLAVALTQTQTASSSPRLFAVENWYKRDCFGPEICAEFKSWRLVEVAFESGTFTGLTSWHGGTLPNSGNLGRLIGAIYNIESDARDQLLVENDSKFSCFDVSKGRSCSDVHAPFVGSQYEEHSGFFTSASFDAVLPCTLLSLYDSGVFPQPAQPDHFATINVSDKGSSSIRFAQNWGVNMVQSVVYVAVNGGLYRVQRVTGEVRELTVPTTEFIEALFSPPVGVSNISESLLVLGCGGQPRSCQLHEVDVELGTSKMFLELPGLKMLTANWKCKSYHEPTSTLYLGCYSVFAVNLKDRKVASVTKVQVTKASKSSESYSVGGVIVMPGKESHQAGSVSV